jgi:diguanylate cyclase (GGDEF)-like protein
LLAWLLLRNWRGRIELEASRAQAQHLAFHDALTGLPNRALFEDRLRHALGQRQSGSFAVVLLDLDRFKNVNDTLGHQAGDALIREFGARLVALLRDGDTIARLGGDEFALLIENATESHVSALCERILHAVRRPFDVLGNQAFVGVSAGVALSTSAGDDPSDLVRKADIALYRAKDDGRNGYRIFTADMDASVKLRGSIEEQLRHALATGEGLRVHYQPEVSGVDGRIVGLEALVRWEHPTRGLIAPQQFVPVGEETGLIVPLGEWVLEEACRTLARWPGMFMAVNLSPVQLQTSNMAERFTEIVRRSGARPSDIQLEMAERVLLDGDDAVRATLSRLRDAGFQIVLDDFGTGYSSLSYLRRFEVDKIKIDQSFVRYLGMADDSSSIVTAVLALGQALGLTVAAEGVETADQRRLLASLGCKEMQGFLFSRAVPEEELASLFGKGAAQAAIRGAA